MAQTIQFDLVAPEKMMLSGAASVVVAPGADGDFGAMPGHAPFLTTLRPGVVNATIDGAERKFVVFGGFAEVGPDRCTILADDAYAWDQASDIGLPARIEAAEKALGEAQNDEVARRAQYLSDLRTLAMVVA